MPILGALLVTLFTGFATFLVQFVGRKVAIGLAFVAVLGTITAVLIALLATVVAPLLSGLFSSSMFGWVGLAFPPISATCITALATSWSGCVLYSWQRESLRLAVAA